MGYRSHQRREGNSAEEGQKVKVIKSVCIPFTPPEEILELLKDFRQMVNYCIKVGLERGVTSRFKLTKLTYRELRRYGYHSWYILSAIEIASTILKNYRKAKRKNPDVKPPKAKRLIAKLGNQAFKITSGKLLFPIKPREVLEVPLHKRALEVLDGVKLGSITITPEAIHIAYSKTVEIKEPRGWIAIDVNELNITAVSSDGEIRVFDLSKIKKAGYGYFSRARKIQLKYCRDRRVLKKALSKLFKNYKNLRDSELHKVSASIIKWANAKQYGIVCEDLRNIRSRINMRIKALNPVNRRIQQISVRSKEIKRRLNMWAFRKFLHQISYKSAWSGVMLKEVSPRKTSTTCPRCGSSLKTYPMGQVKCPRCGLSGNRHVIACLNLLRKVQPPDGRLWFGLDRPPNVAVSPALTNPLPGGCGQAGRAKGGKTPRFLALKNGGSEPPRVPDSLCY